MIKAFTGGPASGKTTRSYYQSIHAAVHREVFFICPNENQARTAFRGFTHFLENQARTAFRGFTHFLENLKDIGTMPVQFEAREFLGQVDIRGFKSIYFLSWERFQAIKAPKPENNVIIDECAQLLQGLLPFRSTLVGVNMTTYDNRNEGENHGGEDN